MYMPMIKSLVMGIKLFVKRRTCPKCTNGILLPYAWKTCEKHDATKLKPRVDRKKRLSHYSIYSFRNVQKIYKIPNMLKSVNLQEKDCLVYDPDTMEIIGWR